MNALGDLFFTFSKIGLFTFGGGYSLISMIEHACVEEKKWITHEDMMDITVIAESTPGPIALNCATYVGYRQKGLLGAIVATGALIFPSFLIIYLISLFMEDFLEIRLIANAFWGIRLGVGILILDAGLNMMKKMPKKPFQRSVMTLSFLFLLFCTLLSIHLSSIVLMVFFGLLSLSLFLMKGKKTGGTT